ncbi:hypothetical protein KP509_17G035300 [Ceratopteris richardii]|uniref:Annexin n=1 Tax=Ceratopteris richardii TaxID=49495 RepID=A0A8T2SVZ7_CERRI|nr:hypothetical protein KP509_17G035300 [Ceratopteris richardii]
MSTIRSPIVPIKPNEDSLNIHRALRGLIYDAGAIIDILAYRNAVQRSQIIVVYKNMFEEDLCKVIKSKLHFHFKKAVLMWMRDPFERDARILRKALRANRSSQRSYVLAEVFSTKSSDDLLSTAKSYHSLYKRSLQTDIEASLSGSCQKVLYKSMKGTGTDDDTLIRIIVTHAETDLAHIKAAFVQRYKVSLSSMIRSDTTYKYRKFLLALVGEDS